MKSLNLFTQIIFILSALLLCNAAFSFSSSSSSSSSQQEKEDDERDKQSYLSFENVE